MAPPTIETIKFFTERLQSSWRSLPYQLCGAATPIDEKVLHVTFVIFDKFEVAVGHFKEEFCLGLREQGNLFPQRALNHQLIVLECDYPIASVLNARARIARQNAGRDR